MAIYLDASVLRGTVSGPELSSIRALAKAHGQAVIVPSIALEEAVANRRRDAERAFQEITSAVEKARGFYVSPTLDLPDPVKLAANWRKELVRAFSILNVSGAQAKEALTRELDRIPPARDGRGARDAAIWLAIRDDHRSKNEAGYFVSANTKDFGQSGGVLLHESLRAELGKHNHHMQLMTHTAALLEALAPSKGREIPYRALAEAEVVQTQVRNALWRDIGNLPMNSVIASAFGRPLHWTGTETRIGEATLMSVIGQRPYELPDKRQVAVIDSKWLVWLTIKITGPREFIDAGHNEATTVVQVSAQVWATTNPSGGDIEWEVARVEQAEVVPAVTDLLRRVRSTAKHRRRKVTTVPIQ